MDHFAHHDGVMHAEDVPLPQIADAVGTPVYVYSRATLERHARVFREALADVPDKLIAFAVKSNPNLAVLKVLGKQGMGADVVSVGEMRRALAAGIGTAINNHCFRATGITAYLKNGGTLERAAAMANHASTRTTQLYDRRSDTVTLDEVERVII